MTAQAELIRIGHAEIVPGIAAVRIVTICAAHLALAQRVMVRHAQLRTLGLMTAEACIVHCRARLYEYIRLG